MSAHAENIFFVGLGGMGMAPLALYLAEAGCAVSGYDDHWREAVRAVLKSRGVDCRDSVELPANASRIVFSSAIAPTHPALQSARERGLPALRRGEMLAEAMRDRRLVAVVGSHGKTTTTALLIHALRSSGHEAGYVLGALFADPQTPPAHFADSPWVAAEIDESDGTIDAFSPYVTVAVNFDWDHADRYRSEEELEATFVNLFRRTKELILIPQWCSRLRRLAEISGTPFRTFGPEGDFSARSASDDGAQQKLALNGVFSKRIVELPLGGEFNAANASAALAAVQAVFGSVSERPFVGYRGVCRRQDVLARQPGLTIYADYAHHPTEIAALMRSLRARAQGRLLVVFQPHRYTRTRQFAPQFAEVLSAADRVFLLPVYAASEPPLPDGTSATILNAAIANGSAQFSFHDSFAGLDTALADALKNSAGETTLVFVGAGDIDEFATAFAQARAGETSSIASNVTNRTDALDWFDVLRARLHPETLVQRNEPLADKTTLGVGGPARYYAEPANREDLVALLTAARTAGTPVFFLGRGSNLIVADSGFPGLVVRLGRPHWQEIRLEGADRIWAGAGVRLQGLCGFAARNGLGGLEFLEGIPGSVGGSLRMNAGAMGGWIFDVVDEIEYVTLGGELHRAARGEFHPSYRECPELLQAIATGAVFRAKEKIAPEEIRRRMDTMATKRRSSQPRERSAGCLFKNPPGGFAGRLIDQLGLKGRRVGGIEVSNIHANFIVNHGNGTAAEALELARQVRGEVSKNCGVLLEPEVLLLGKNWEDVLS